MPGASFRHPAGTWRLHRKEGDTMRARPISARVALLFALLLLVALGSALAASLPSSHLTSSRGQLGQALRLDRFASQLGIQPATERDNPAEGEAFWVDRLTYPTGRFDPRWLLRA